MFDFFTRKSRLRTVFSLVQIITIISSVIFPGLILALISAKPVAHATSDIGNPEKWRKSWGTGADDHVGDTAIDSEGNVYVTVSSTSKDLKESHLIKFDNKGEELWRRTLLRAVDTQYKVSVGKTGNAFVVGGTNSLNELLVYDPDGELISQNQLDNRLLFPAVSVDPDDNAYVAGTSNTSESGDSPNWDAFLAKYNKDGVQAWIKQIGTTEYDRAVDVSAEQKDIIHVLGETKGALEGNTRQNGWSNSFLGKYRSDGTKIWLKQYGSGSGDYMATPRNVVTGNSGIAYTTVGQVHWGLSVPSGSKWLIRKHNLIGGIIWESGMPTGLHSGTAIAVDRLENVYAFGVKSYFEQFESYLVKFNEDGKLKWKKTIDTTWTTIPTAIDVGIYGDIHLAGHTHNGFEGSSNSGGFEAFLIQHEGDDYDEDGDGLLDRWEINGLKVKDQFIDLPAMGANPRKKDIFVEIDWMAGKTPKELAIERVVKSFADAPVKNPDGTKGINLHVDLGPNSVMRYDTGQLWGEYSRASQVPFKELLGSRSLWSKKYIWDDFDEIKKANYDDVRKPVFHYAVFAHRIGGFGDSSGISRGIGASDFIVSLGGFDNGVGTENQQAGTFMHELGHNIALAHGGFEDENYKPNYLSIMNYSFQTEGLIKKGADGNFSGGHMDYSRFDDLEDLDEAALDENLGVSSKRPNPAHSDYQTIYYLEDTAYADHLNTPVDWNRNGSIDTDAVSVNINDGDKKNPAELSVLITSKDWHDHMKLKGGSIGQLGLAMDDLPAETPDLDELTEELDDQLYHPYRVAVRAPENTAKEPGVSLSHSFTVTNIGDQADNYKIEAKSSNDWANLSGVPSSISLSPGSSQNIVIPMTIPTTAIMGTEAELKLFAFSENSENIYDSGAVVTLAKPKEIGSEVRITDKNSPSNLYPAVSGDWIVWFAEYQGIWAQNVATGVKKMITSMGGQPHIDGSRVVYSKETKNPDGTIDPGDVYMYDLGTNVERRITTAPRMQITPRIHGDRIVWQDNRIAGNADIYMYDLSTETEQRITTDAKNQYYPDINGDRIVWEDHRNVTSWAAPYNYDIYMYDLLDLTERQITTQTYVQSMPRIYGDTIVWWDQRNDSGDIYLYDLATGTERGLDQSGYQAQPSIDRHRIAYTDWTSGDIFMYNMKAGTHTKVTTHIRKQYEPAIQGKRIVYRDERISGSGYNTDIYMTNLILGEPATTIASNPASPGTDGWFVAKPELTLTSNPTGANIYYQWDSTSELGWSGYTGPFTAPEGEHTLYYYAEDDTGNREATKSAVIKVDTIGPETNISSEPSFEDQIAGVFKTVPQITLDTGEEGNTYYQWDSASESGWNEYTEPINGIEGEHTLYFYSTDIHGNAEDVKSREFNVNTDYDTIPAETSLSTEPAFPDSGKFEDSPIISLSANEPAVIYYQWDSEPTAEFTTETIPQSGWISGADPVFAPVLDGLAAYQGRILAPEGTHTLYYYSVDAAGNVEPVKSRVFIVEEPESETPVTTGITIDPESPDGDEGWYKAAPQISLTPNMEATIHYRWNEDDEMTFAGDPDQPLVISAPQGINTLKYYSSAGSQVEDEATRTFKVDTSAPVTTDLLSGFGGNNGWYVSNVEVSLVAADAVSGVFKTEYRLDGAAWVPYLAPFTINKEGATFIEYRSVDAAGNLETASSKEVKIDKSPPAISVSSPEDAKTYLLDQLVLANWSALDNQSGILGSEGTASSGSAIDTWSLGQKSFVIGAEDQAGNKAVKLITYYVGEEQQGAGFIFLPPLTKYESCIFKYGSSIPVKFELRDSNGNFVTTASPRLYVSQLTNGTVQSENKAVSSSNPSEDNLFRYDTDDNQYVFNLNSKILTVGKWRLRIDLGDDSLNYVDITLK